MLREREMKMEMMLTNSERGCLSIRRAASSPACWRLPVPVDLQCELYGDFIFCSCFCLVGAGNTRKGACGMWDVEGSSLEVRAEAFAGHVWSRRSST
jgi:hypothetical protein